MGDYYTGLVDNQQDNTLARAIRRSWETLHQAGIQVEEVCIASGFFNLAGFRLLADLLEEAPQVRLLLGVEPRPEAELPEAEPGISPEQTMRQLVEEQLRLQTEGLNRQRDLLPFDRQEDEWVRRLLKLLYSEKLQVRRCSQRILHAKLYLLRSSNAGMFVGSSNLTWGGLAGNLELNLGTSQPELVEQARQWFDSLWETAEPFNLAEIYDRLMEEYDPFLIYLRVLYELYGDQLQDLPLEDRIPLREFQKHGAWRAWRIMQQYGGALVADGVGLGKTYIAGAIAWEFIKNRQRVLLICPASLRDTTWKSFLNEYQLYAETLSYEQLAEEKQLVGDRPGSRAYLQRAVEEYALVIIDEAHHYRNPNTPARAQTLRRLLRKAKYPKLLLLTATPVNNSLWDLYYLLRYFLRQDTALLTERGIISLRQRFQQAMREDPFNLEPDLLYPILDATTVKRTRGFIQREYPNELIKLDNGQEVPIRFPEPVLETIRYQLNPTLIQLLDELEQALAPPTGAPALRMSRYQPEQYRLPEYREEELPTETPIVGLLRSALLKRFESSVHAFRKTLQRMIQEHETFLQALDQGKVLRKDAVKEISAASDEEDEESLAELIADAPAEPASQYDIPGLRQAVENDLQRLRQWEAKVGGIRPEEDPKLEQLGHCLAAIAQQAAQEAYSNQDQRQKQKVIVFSCFEDTIDWIEQYLQERLKTDERLQVYRGRMVSISGQPSRHGVPRDEAIKQFAPSAANPSEAVEDRYDLLLATDVISEGMNLQDCRNIINFDLPWNPMRLVQRHGRVDRITSRHEKIYLRTFFPAEALKRLLDLDERIRRKLAQAAASVGVETPPIEDSPQADRSFAETRAEIEQIYKQTSEIFKEGDRPSAALSSEEHRAKLRKGLEKYRDQILQMPWKAGSGMYSQQEGYVFLARVGHPKSKLSRCFLRFVPASGQPILREEGTCLRWLQCQENTPRVLPDTVRLNAYDAWKRAREDIYQEWMNLTDPQNLEPRLRPLQHEVYSFLKKNPPPTNEPIDRLLDRVLNPWPLAAEREIREIFNNPSLQNQPTEKARQLAEKIIEFGIEPFRKPEPLPEIRPEEIHLVCWLALIRPEGPPKPNSPLP
ncbi:MAG: phospholipase D-like domain-containing protein [Thermoguttaceae bacterium]|nr:phospholipase D-like domain-containing protein [Thermoguttaceae bacterium]MDW8037601.1 phospholipase D-like domain-containing protein [Thermoguttaceae bacterium]